MFSRIRPTDMFFLIVLLAMLLSPVVDAANVEGVRLWRAPDNTRLVFDLNSPAHHQVFMLPSPNRRLVIDIDSSEFKADVSQLDFSGTPIKGFRYGKRKEKHLRVVLDLDKDVKPRSFALKKHAGKPDRFVIDLYDVDKGTTKTIAATVATKEGEKRDVIIAIDAGHGGEDPGALGPNRIKEKDVVLKISQELARLIDAEPGYEAKLVRTGDYYIPLKDRRDKARNLRADLFVSVHADAFKNPRAKGASVFALSNRGATSETARFLAAKENEADLIGGVGGVSLGDKDQILAGVLVDLSMTATLDSSLNVGEKVLRQVGSVNKLHKHQVEQAGFAVLKSPDVPSILVETGFISNPEEARKLGNANHRRKLAHAIFKGVKGYFSDHPPAGSYLAWKKSNGGEQQYVISRGDTLSAIARRFDVTVNQLIKVNRLSGVSIKVGQRITIPAS